MIAAKFKEAKEAALKFTETCKNQVANAMKTVFEGFSKVSSSVANAKSDAKDMLAVLNGEVASKAETKVHELNIKAM